MTLLKQPDILESKLKAIPLEPGVYLMKNARQDILYIGKSKKLRQRVRSYFRDFQRGQSVSHRIGLMVQQVADFEIIVTDTEAEALALEANLIKQHQPHYNVLLKDDKKYPYVCITWSEEYPRIFITRKRRLGQQSDRYYGPYVDSGHLRSTLNLIKNHFPLRQRRQPLFKDRPCLNYDLGKCPGVCQSLVSPAEYRQTLGKVALVFQGRIGELEQELTAKMGQAAQNLDFERAATLRDQLQALQGLTAGQKVSLPDDRVSQDAIALASDGQYCAIQLFQVRAGRLVGRLGFFLDLPPGDALENLDHGPVLQRVLEEHYQPMDGVEIPSQILVQAPLPDGEILQRWLSDRKGRKVEILCPQRQQKAELIAMVAKNAHYELQRSQRALARQHQSLDDLAELLALAQRPHRIEGYDISHIQGSNAVASQVVFIDGIPAKQHYRHYKIKNPQVHVGRSDDFASLAEVLGRRFQKPDALLPDLIMIDGGKGQLSAVMAVLTELGLSDRLNVVSLAKKREEIFCPGASHPLETDSDQPGVQLLRRVRDEAHRFAVGFHRQQRLKHSRHSHLDDIPGLGWQKQKQLLAHFHSLDYIRQAQPPQLMEVPGIGSALAQKIYDYFH